MSRQTVDEVVTTGQIAEALGVSIFKTIYLIKTRSIQPLRKAGNARLFSPDVIETLKSEINHDEPME